MLCWYCGEPANTRDHIVPRSKRGGTKPNNLRPACNLCNQCKSDSSVEEFRQELRDRYARFDSKPTWWRVVRRLRPWNFVFYGERVSVEECNVG
jgi:5-methylcytosine-specific restriction endonuclease McrA